MHEWDGLTRSSRGWRRSTCLVPSGEVRYAGAADYAAAGFGAALRLERATGVRTDRRYDTAEALESTGAEHGVPHR